MEQKILRELVDGILAIMEEKIIRIVLYGSVARGTNTIDSDVDIALYAIFHGLRAVTALDNFDSSKHSGVIAYINRVYVKKGVFEKNFSKMLDTAFRLREKADYQYFFIVSREMANAFIRYQIWESRSMWFPYLVYT